MTEQHQPEPPVAQTTCASARRASFRWLWSGQLISNLGTQTSLYGIGLWLFARSGRLLDFGMVALVVQLARLLALPLVGSVGVSGLTLQQASEGIQRLQGS